MILSIDLLSKQSCFETFISAASFILALNQQVYPYFFPPVLFSIIIYKYDVRVFSFAIVIISFQTKKGFSNKNINVYCMINNGFYGSWQNYVAVDIMKNWCNAAGLTYGQTPGMGQEKSFCLLKIYLQVMDLTRILELHFKS